MSCDTVSEIPPNKNTPTTGDLEHTTQWSLDSSIPGNMIQDRPSVVQGSDRPAQLLFAQAVLEVRVAELVE